MSGKRKRIVVSLETKLEAIRRLDKGETVKKIATDIGVGEVTVGDWRRNRVEIEKWCSEKTCGSSKGTSRKTMKKCEFDKTSKALFLWFMQLREKGSLITGPMLQGKALEFRKKFNDGTEEFTASAGWLDRWKKRYGIQHLNISENASVDCEEIVKFKTKLKRLIKEEGLTLDQIFNCDETSLNFKMLPTKTLAALEKSEPGYKRSRERVTVLACSNASGNLKVKIMLIGKSKNLRAFKKACVPSFPVYYKNQKSAQIESTFFEDWFNDEFVPSVETFLQKQDLPRKAILLLDNAPSHPDSDDMVSGDIKAIFMPPNVTSLIQPLDRVVMENLKRNYRQRMLKTLIKGLEEGKSIVECLKKITLKDVVYWVAEAWDDVKPSTLNKSWKRILYSETLIEESLKDNSEEESLLELAKKLPISESLNEQDITNWMNADEEQERTNDMRVNTKNQQDENKEDSNEDRIKISHTEGLKAIETTIQYIEQQKEATPADLLLLKQWRDKVAAKQVSRIKQMTMKDFFVQ